MGLRSDIDDVREQIHRDHLLLLATDVRVTVQKAKLLLADFLLEQKFNRMMRAVKANFNPAQPRVPAGNSDGGRWTDEDSNWERLRAQYANSAGTSDRRVVLDVVPDSELLMPGADYAADGHHYVPQAVYKRARAKYSLSDDVLKIFRNAKTGKLNVPSSNFYGPLHKAYNDAVEEAFDRFVNSNNIGRGQMTTDQAQAFVKEVKASRDPRISGFNLRLWRREILFFIRRGFRGNE